jgi:hypothetical protein
MKSLILALTLLSACASSPTPSRPVSAQMATVPICPPSHPMVYITARRTIYGCEPFTIENLHGCPCVKP